MGSGNDLNGPERAERRLPVLSLSRGIAFGPVAFWQNERLRPLKIQLTDEQIESEVARLQNAGDEAIRQIQELSTSAGASDTHPVAGIMDVHRAIIEESSFIDKVEAVIRSEHVNAEWALRKVSTEFIERQAAVPDKDLREKHIDLADVSDRLQRALAGSRLASTRPGAVIVAEALRPSTVVELSKRSPAAIVTDRAGWTSHTSILARELELPMVSGVPHLTDAFVAGQNVIVDADDGELIVDPTPKTLAQYSARRARAAQQDIVVSDRSGLTTLDGTSIIIRANADSEKAYAHAFDLGARGIGLFRSESLIREPDMLPSEDDQLLAYSSLADAAGTEGIKIRTFDIESGDPGRPPARLERNPALGLRSLRLSLSDEPHFRVQIRAILRAAFGRVIGIVLPMIGGIGEFRRCRELISQERANLAGAGFEVGEPALGTMIEIPSAVVTIAAIAAESDFLCVGTNDLVQYLLAVDRDNDAVADWYQTLHPAVIACLRQILSAAESAGKPVTICGEMAGSPFYVPLLIGLGARELSMNVNSINRVRRLISGITVSDCQHLANEVSGRSTAAEIEQQLRHYYQKHWADLFPPGLLETRHR